MKDKTWQLHTAETSILNISITAENRHTFGGISKAYQLTIAVTKSVESQRFKLDVGLQSNSVHT